MSRSGRNGRGEQPLRLAVVGLGHFAQEFILPAVTQVGSVELVGLVSSSEEKLRVLGDRHRVEARADYDDLERLIEDARVDAVYIAVPNDMHAEMTIRAARAGAHVLCEKPMAPTDEECRAMMRECRQAGVKLMVAYRLHFEAGNLHAIELARDGELGDPRVFSSTFTMQVQAGNIRVQPRAGAGPLFDIGIYCINAARYLFRAEPQEVVALSATRPGDHRFEAADETVAAILRFPDERVANFVVSYGATDTARYELIGTRGRLSLDHAYDLVEPMELELIQDGKRRTRTFKKRDQVAAEVEYFARCVREDRDPEPSAEEGLADIHVILAIEESMRTGRVVAVDSVEQHRRPDPDQEIRFPMHRRPELVDVESPSQ